MGRHGPSNVLRGIQKSCNVFFYETGYLLGGKKLEEWEHKFGFGEKTGIEIGESAGSASGPENRKRMLENVPTLNPWQEPAATSSQPPSVSATMRLRRFSLRIIQQQSQTAVRILPSHAAAQRQDLRLYRYGQGGKGRNNPRD